MSLKFPSNYFNIEPNANEKIFATEHELREKIYELKDKLTELESENKKNLLRISELSQKKQEVAVLEKANKDLNEILIKKDETISGLKSLLLQEKRDKNEEKRILERDYDYKLTYYKRLQDTNDYKEKSASHIIKLNELQHLSIIKLENKIDENKKYYENQLKEKELNFDRKYTKLKKEMMEFLKNAQKKMNATSKKDLELNTKLGILYKNEMLNELENQSHLIEELIKEKERQSKEIYLLKQELIFHKKVEEMFKIKNSKFLNVINKINIKINQKKEKDNNSQEEKDNSNIVVKSEKHKSKSKLIMKDLKKRAKSVKSFNMNCFEGNAGILNNYITGNTSNSNSELNKKIIENSVTPKKIEECGDKKIFQSTKENYIKSDLENEYCSSQDNKPEIYAITNKIINSCSKALEIIYRENIPSQSIQESYFKNDINIKYDYLKLKDEQKYELLIGIITKVLNFLKRNNNTKEKKDDFLQFQKKKSELSNYNDEYNIKFSKLLDNDNFNKIKKLKMKNQQLKYDKAINYIGVNKQKYSASQKDFFSFKIKRHKLLNQKGNVFFNSFTKKSAHPLQRYIHISKDINQKYSNNNTFFKNKI